MKPPLKNEIIREIRHHYYSRCNHKDSFKCIVSLFNLINGEEELSDGA